MISMKLADIAKVVDGEVLCQNEENDVGSIDIDFMTPYMNMIKPRCLFLIRQNTPKPQEDAREAFAKGAVCCLTSSDIAIEHPLIKVKSTDNALKSLTAHKRNHHSIPITMITGTCGKTTTKELTHHILSTKHNVKKTPGSANARYPLFSTFLSTDDTFDAYVCEAGIVRFGALKKMSEVLQPDYAVITNIGTAHTEGLRDREGVFKAKTELLSHVKPTGTIFLNGSDDMLITLKGKYPNICFFGLNNPEFDYYADDIQLHTLEGTSARINTPKGSFYIHLALPGEHSILNALAAIAVCEKHGLSANEIASACSAFRPVDGRLNIKKNVTDEITIIDDSYNASPESVKAAIEVLSLAEKRKVCFIGDSLELGELAIQKNIENVSHAVKNGIDVIVCIGELVHYGYLAALSYASKSQILLYYKDLDMLLPEVESILQTGDTVLIKASNAIGLSKLARVCGKLWQHKLSVLSADYPMADPLVHLKYRNNNYSHKIDPIFAGRLAALARDHGRDGKMHISAGRRSTELQLSYYEAYLRYEAFLNGGEEAPKANYALAPANSAHVYGEAIDIETSKSPELAKIDFYNGGYENQTILAQYGLYKPYHSDSAHPEKWHIEPIETVGCTDLNKFLAFEGAIGRQSQHDCEAMQNPVVSSKDLLRRTKSIFILYGMGERRTGIPTSVLRKVKLMQDEWDYSPIILVQTYSINLRRTVRKAIEEGILRNDTKIFSVYDYFQKAYVDREPINRIKRENEFRYEEVSPNTFRVTLNAKHIRTESFTAPDNGLRFISCFDLDGKETKREYYDDLGYLSMTQFFSSDNHSQVAHEIYYDIYGTACIRSFYTYKGKEKILANLQLLSFAGNVIKEFKREVDFLSYCIDVMTSESEEETIYYVTAEPARTHEALLGITKKNLVKGVVFHNTFMRDAYDLNGSVKSSFSVSCNNTMKYDGIVLLTRDEEADLIAKYGNHENTFVIPHMFPYKIEYTPFEQRDMKKVVIVSRFDGQKQLDYAVRIFAEVVKILPDVRLEIFGFGPEESIVKKAISDLRMENNVFIKGFTKNPFQEFSSAALSMCTSKGEGFTLTLVESISCGCPTLSYDIKYGSSDIIQNDVNGYLFPRNDIAKFAAKMVELLRDPIKLRQLSSGAFETAKRFSPSLFLENYYSMYEKIALKKGLYEKR